MNDTDRMVRMIKLFGEQAVDILRALGHAGHPKDLLDDRLEKMKTSWTTDKPTLPGFYWALDNHWKEDGWPEEEASHIVQVELMGKGYVVYVIGDDEPRMVDEFEEWAGPLELPR